MVFWALINGDPDLDNEACREMRPLFRREDEVTIRALCLRPCDVGEKTYSYARQSERERESERDGDIYIYIHIYTGIYICTHICPYLCIEI